MSQKRRVEISVNGSWIECSFSDVQKGNKFRLFEEDETPVALPDGTKVFIASANAFKDGENWVLETNDDEE